MRGEEVGEVGQCEGVRVDRKDVVVVLDERGISWGLSDFFQGEVVRTPNKCNFVTTGSPCRWEGRVEYWGVSQVYEDESVGIEGAPGGFNDCGFTLGGSPM